LYTPRERQPTFVRQRAEVLRCNASACIRLPMRLCWLSHRKKHLEVQELRNVFSRNEDGSWTCIDSVTIDHPQGRVQVAPGTALLPGILYMGIDLANWLDEQIKKNAPPPG
jgi:hypothetical protein